MLSCFPIPKKCDVLILSFYWLSFGHFTHGFAFILKVKKCAEMARKLRFLKEQMSKAGISPSGKIMMRGDIDVDDLEVQN